MDYQTWPSLVAMFYDVAALRKDRPFAWTRNDGGFRPLTWGRAAAQVAALAETLKRLGVAPGDRVMLVGENRAEWPVADLGIMAAGGITVPAYTTNRADDHRHILADSGVKGAIVSTAALARVLIPALDQVTPAGFLIAMEPILPAPEGRTLESWDHAVAGAVAGSATPPPPPIARGDTACLIYTSGTGGLPKGVMLSHGAILANCMAAHDLLTEIGLGDEVFLSFLPLSHAYEHTCGQFFPISIGAQIYFTDAEHLSRDLVVVRPTIMTAVPRLYETMYHRITRGTRRQSGLKQRLFRATLDAGRRKYETGKSLPVIGRIIDFIGEITVRRAVRAGFGGRLKAMISGGAPLNPDIGVFFTALGLRILQGYGQTEAAPVVSCNRPRRNRIETVGPPLKGVETRIAADGEILVRGELVMQGYWNNPEATAEVLRDGWLHTGDIGLIDEAGCLRITDRKKDIIVNSGGDNISPQRIEGMLTLQPEIGQAMVYGDRHPHLVALIVPDAAFAEAWSAEHADPRKLAALVADPAFEAAVTAAVERVNRNVSVIERVRRVTLTAEPFTIDNAMMTPTLKIRRHAIRQVHGPALEALYDGAPTRSVAYR